jgi:hypothetical protein
MLSLAALNYRDILASSGGPIDRITTGTVEVLGKVVHQANAFLRSGLIAGKPELNVYGNADGTGANASAQVARHMAVSEALERWAYHAVSQSPDAARYGFHIDNSTNGMAAYPGFYKGQARTKAYYEALERWALVSWWSGHFDAAVEGTKLGVTALRLKHTADFGEIAVLYRRAGSGHVGYGYSAGATFKIAVARAAVELSRHEFVVSLYKLFGASREVSHYFERRSLYFAGEEGHQAFQRRLANRVKQPGAPWSVLYDGEVVGPWSRYATVWRVVPKMPNLDFLDPTKLFFFW